MLNRNHGTHKCKTAYCTKWLKLEMDREHLKKTRVSCRWAWPNNK